MTNGLYRMDLCLGPIGRLRRLIRLNGSGVPGSHVGLCFTHQRTAENLNWTFFRLRPSSLDI